MRTIIEIRDEPLEARLVRFEEQNNLKFLVIHEPNDGEVLTATEILRRHDSGDVYGLVEVVPIEEIYPNYSPSGSYAVFEVD